MKKQKNSKQTLCSPPTQNEEKQQLQLSNFKKNNLKAEKNKLSSKSSNKTKTSKKATTEVLTTSSTTNKTKAALIKSSASNKTKKVRPNFSKAHKTYIRRLRRDKFWIFFFRVFILVAFLGLWEILTRYKVLDPFFFSSPSRICAQIAALARAGTLWTDIWVTLSETLIGFAIATVLGYVIAVLLWWNEKVRRVFEPYIVVLNSLPKIALGPIIILWVGAGTKAIVLMCVLICIVITTMSMLSAFLSVEEGKILLLKSMHANKFQILRKLVLPNSMPDFVSVLKINVGMSWVGSIMGEYLTSKAGLGYQIVYGGQIFKMDLVMSSTLILCVLAFGMYFLVSLLEKRYSHSRGK